MARCQKLLGSNARGARSGSTYVITLGAALIVSLLAMASVLSIQVHRKHLEEATRMYEARLYARAAADRALHYSHTDPDWRQKMAADTWDVDLPIGNGVCRFRASDVDGDLLDSEYDSVQITAIGESDFARQLLRVDLRTTLQPLGCLDVALHGHGPLTFDQSQVASNHTISSNDSVLANAATINASVEAVGTISGGSYQGPTTTGVPPRSIPSSGFDTYYLSRGTAISYAALPPGSTADRRAIDAQLIGPTQNPWGSPNPQGIYVIDCGGSSLEIRRSRLVATLVVQNAQEVIVEDSMCWEPPQANYPVLLVSGNGEIKLSSAALQELLIGNLNPPGAEYPYPEGVSNSLPVDAYPSTIRGLIYVTGRLIMGGETSIRGVLASGGDFLISPAADVSINFDAVFRTNPPPGFESAISLEVDQGSWRQVLD